MLILGVGLGTKTLPTFLTCRKTYETVVVFGVATDTYDRLGKVVARDETKLHGQQQEEGGKNPYEHVTREKVLAALDRFRGKVWQVPPIYSAKWMNGKRLYDYARQGLPLPEEIKGKDVVVEEMEMVEWLEPGTHGYGIPDKVADKVVDDNEGDGQRDAGNKKNEVGRFDGVAESRGTKQMTKGVKRARGDDGKDDRTAIAAAASTLESPSDAMSRSPKKLKLDAKADELVTGSHDIDDKNDKSASTLIPATTTTTNDADKSSKLTTVATTTTKNAASSLLTSTIIQPESESGSESQRPAEHQSHLPQILPSPLSPPAAKLRMTVSSGFYVRSLCHDLGIAIGSFGFMAELVRTRQAEFELGPENGKNGETDNGDNVDNGDDVIQKKEKKQEIRGNVLEYADLQKGEEVWGPRVKELIRDNLGNGKISLGQAGRGRNGNGMGNERSNGRRNTSSPE